MCRFVAFCYCFSCHFLLAQDQLSQNRVEKSVPPWYGTGHSFKLWGRASGLCRLPEAASPTDSRRGEAEYYVAFSALSLGHNDGEKLIDDFIDHNPSSPKASTAYYDLANFFYAESNYAKASNTSRK